MTRWQRIGHSLGEFAHDILALIAFLIVLLLLADLFL
jgi:hypothetical protein